eukprot:gnl/TRDRNA2_/TRDRNA2_182213_c0_seq1.p1 gnl/TRDRNA2_/TRDRNA2_182213_c0~~gnl/TRDRNA2_/TRDRNA2_182213_c0_seq1.p1  ORF type:complete len:277 (+),score=68.08 gnl/TRDRNA2_/TRDRNA2_182213_c0_seq1:75-905(+)
MDQQIGSMSDAEAEDARRPFVEAEREFEQLQAAGDHEAAVRCLENVLRSHQAAVQQMQGHVLTRTFEQLTVGYNTLGMKHLKEGNTETSCKYFEKAEALTDPANSHMNPDSRLVLRAVTYNNMGCFYKSMSKLHTALQYLRKAQKIEERPNSKCQNPAGTHLNLCALLSHMGKHQEALVHAQNALKLLEASSPEEASNNGESLICVAYFNMAAEFEHLKKFGEALWAYQQAYESCLTELGEEHPLSKQISSCLTQLKTSKSTTAGARKGASAVAVR